MDKVARPGSLTALASRAREGDEVALEGLLTEVHVHIHRFFGVWLYKRRGWQDAVDDLAQETLLKIARNIGSCAATNDTSLLAWCRSIAENAGIDYLRSMRDEWDAITVLGSANPTSTADSDPQMYGTEADTGAEIVLRILHQVHEAEDTEAQALLWHRLVQGDEWTETGC